MKKWFGSRVCDFCGKMCNDVLYDAKTKYGGSWATMCADCFQKHGLGIIRYGFGQMYKMNEDNEMMLVAGGSKDVDTTE